MNRTLIAAALICAVAAAPSRAATSQPGIGGGVFESATGDPIVGVSVQLFADDGDGIFDMAADTQVGMTMTTDADGQYGFDELDVNAKYFVQQPAQDILGLSQPAQVSGLLSPGAALMVIDDFDNQQLLKADPNNPAGSSAISDSMSTALGAERDMYVELIDGIGDVELRSNRFGMDVLQYDTSSGVVGRAIVTWDGVDFSANPQPSLDLGDVDLTSQGEATGLLLMLGVDMTGAGNGLRLRIFDDDSTVFSEAAVDFPVTGGRADETTYVPFDDFVGPVKPDHVNAIQLFMGGGARSIDAQIDWIRTVGDTTHDFEVVPEPAAVLLLLIGLTACLPFRR